MKEVLITAFKDYGKYYTENNYRIPENIEPWNLVRYLIDNGMLHYPNMCNVIEYIGDVKDDNWFPSILFIPNQIDKYYKKYKQI